MQIRLNTYLAIDIIGYFCYISVMVSLETIFFLYIDPGMDACTRRHEVTTDQPDTSYRPGKEVIVERSGTGLGTTGEPSHSR